MTTPDDKMSAAELVAKNASIESEKAHLAADDAAREAKVAGTEAAKARKEATAADNEAVMFEDTAAIKEGEVEVANAACKSAMEQEERDQGAVRNASTEVGRVQGLNPGVCNADTDLAEKNLKGAEGRLEATKARRTKECGDAANMREDADKVKAEAVAKRKDADAKDIRADLVEDQKAVAETRAEDLRLKAVQKAELADIVASMAKFLKNDLAANGDNVTATAPKHPSTTGEAGLCGQGPQADNGPGIHSATDGNFTVGTGKASYFLFGGEDYEKVEGKLVELTEGNSVTHTLAADVSVVVGGRLDETFGVEFKVDMGDDTRKVYGRRWERNVGIKVEHVRGIVDETVMGSRTDHNPTFYFGKNPKKRAECDKKLNHKAQQIIQKNEDKFEEFRRKLKIDYSSQKQKMDSITSRIKDYKANLEQVDQDIKTLNAKVDDLKQQAKNYAMNSDGFIKFLVSGSVNIDADRFKGKADGKYQIVCDAIAELQGNEVKWA